MNANRLPDDEVGWCIVTSDLMEGRVRQAASRLGISLRSFASDDEVRAALASKSPICIIADGGTSRLELIRSIRSLAWPSPAVFLSDGQGHQILMRDGVHVVLEEPFSTQQLQDALSDAFTYALAKRNHFAKRRDAQVSLGALSEIQQFVLQHIIAGQPHKMIARRLGVSVRTVDSRRKEIFTGLKVRTISELIAMVYFADGIPTGYEDIELRQSLLRTLHGRASGAESLLTPEPDSPTSCAVGLR